MGVTGLDFHHTREVDGDERQAWWDRSVAAFPNYAEYQARTERRIPVLIAAPI